MTRGNKAVSDQDPRQILKRANDPILTAREVADRADITRQAAPTATQHTRRTRAVQYSISGDAEVLAGAGQRECQTLYLSDTEENDDEERADGV